MKNETGFAGQILSTEDQGSDEARDYIGQEQRQHYAKPFLSRCEDYDGRATIWDINEARAVQTELIEYFGGDSTIPLPSPPFGLPGRSIEPRYSVMRLLDLGVRYFVACVGDRPRRLHTLYSEMEQALHAEYRRGRRDAEDEYLAREEGRILGTPFAFPDPAAGFVYFIGSESGPIKIGKADNPESRLKSLATAHHERLAILATTAGGFPKEAEYHKRFAALRLHGEWFERHPDILAEIAHLNQTAEGVA